MKVLLLIIGLLTVLSSCTNSSRNDNDNEFDPGALFYDYKISGEEGSDSVTVILQYRFGSYEEFPAVLDSGSKVTLDGREIKADSTKLSGVFYEAMISAEDSKSAHSIAFTDKNGESHRHEFTFLPFKLTAALPAQIKKEPLTIQLSGFDKEPTRVQLVMIDTAFSTRDVNEEVVVQNGKLAITAKMWRALKAGPVTLEIYREKKFRLKKE